MRWLALGIVKGQIAWQLDTIPRSHCIVAWFFKLTPLFQLSRQASLREPVAAMRFLTGSIERFDPGAEGRHRPSDLQIAAHSPGCLPVRNHPNPPLSLEIMYLRPNLIYRFRYGDPCTRFETMNAIWCCVEFDDKKLQLPISMNRSMFREWVSLC